MKPPTIRTVTVFVLREPDGFHGFAESKEAIHPNSSRLASRLAAARFFGVPEEKVELRPTGMLTMEASVRQPMPAAAWDFLAVALVALGMVLLVYLAAKGGAK